MADVRAYEDGDGNIVREDVIEDGRLIEQRFYKIDKEGVRYLAKRVVYSYADDYRQTVTILYSPDGKKTKIKDREITGTDDGIVDDETVIEFDANGQKVKMRRHKETYKRKPRKPVPIDKAPLPGQGDSDYSLQGTENWEWTWDPSQGKWILKNHQKSSWSSGQGKWLTVTSQESHTESPPAHSEQWEGAVPPPADAPAPRTMVRHATLPPDPAVLWDFETVSPGSAQYRNPNTGQTWLWDDLDGTLRAWHVAGDLFCPPAFEGTWIRDKVDGGFVRYSSEHSAWYVDPTNGTFHPMSHRGFIARPLEGGFLDYLSPEATGWYWSQMDCAWRPGRAPR